MYLLHDFLNHPVTDHNGDLLWAAARAMVAVCAIIAAAAVRYSTDRYLAYAAFGLGVLLFLKMVDDIDFSLLHRSGQSLTIYFLISNIFWALILIGLARMAIRKRKALHPELGNGLMGHRPA